MVLEPSYAGLWSRSWESVESHVSSWSRSRFSKLLEWVFQNCWSRSRVFKNAGVGFKKVRSQSRFFELEQFMGWSWNPKKSSDSTTLLIWKHVGTQKISTQSSKLVVGCRPLYASPEDGDALICQIGDIVCR